MQRIRTEHPKAEDSMPCPDLSVISGLLKKAELYPSKRQIKMLNMAFFFPLARPQNPFSRKNDLIFY